MLFPKAPETEIEITKIIGYNYKVNFRALGGDLISCFGNDDASPGQLWFAELTEESGPHLCPRAISWRGEVGAEDKKTDARGHGSCQAQQPAAWRPLGQGHR